MLKLYINESAYMLEDIDAVKKYYPNIDDNTFMNLIALDPTYRDGSNSVGKYGKWILNLYNKGTISENDFSEVTSLLNQFNTYKNRIQNKDLNSYKTLDALADTLEAVIEDDSMLTDRQKLRFLKNVKAGRVSTSAENDYDIVLNTPNFIVYVPNTHEASMKLGKGTEWCTAHENPQWYNQYTENNGKLYIIKNKKTGERWQYSDSTDNFLKDFLDENDKGFDIPKLMRQDKELSKFFEKFLGIDYFNFDGTYTYDGEDISDSLRSDVTEITISNSVNRIGRYAFANCKLLTSVTIPDNIVEIGEGAFENCRLLTSITIPDSVTEIGSNAFSECTSLTSIVIPDGVDGISRLIFSDCRSLTSVTIPNTVTEIMDYAFEFCQSLKSITIPNDVTYIGDSAFGHCKSLTSIIIPDAVTEIGNFAFAHCSALTSIIVPDSVAYIGDSAFYNCSKGLIIYTNNEYVINYCDEYNIPVKPISQKESYKLHIKEY